MEGFVPYLGCVIVIVVVALVAVYLKKNGIFVRRVKHGKTEVEFEPERINDKEKSGDEQKDQSEAGKIDHKERCEILRIFLSSPDGLGAFRDTFCDEVEFFNREHAEKRNVLFRVEKWEDNPTGYGRPQSSINEKLAICVGYVLLLHDRWGSPPGESGGSDYSSGSEEEFKVAEGMIKRKQMQRIGVYFKRLSPAKLQSPDEQLTKVLEFNQWLKVNHVLLYNEFADKVEFRRQVHTFLNDWLDQIAPLAKPEVVKSVFDFEKF